LIWEDGEKVENVRINKLWLLLSCGLLWLMIIARSTDGMTDRKIESDFSLKPIQHVSADNTISLDAKDADIRDILLQVARGNNINLVMDDSVKGRVTICLNNVSPLSAMELVIRTNGFVVEKVDNLYIAAAPERIKDMLPNDLKVIKLEYASAAVLKESLSGIMGERLNIQADPQTNSLIITGTSSSVSELERIIGFLDIEKSSEPEVPTAVRVFPLKHTQASLIQNLISEFISEAGKVQVDDRTNSLIVVDQIPYIERLAEAIGKLDVELQSGDEDEEVALYTRVFKLNYTDANAIMNVFQDMLSPNGKIQTFIRQKESIVPLQTESIGFVSGERSRNLSDPHERYGQKWSDILVITDTADVIEKIDKLIKDLDTRTDQVMIEAKMVEINLNEVENLGIDWQATHHPSKSTLKTQIPANRTDGKVVPLVFQIGTLTTRHFEDIMLKIQALETNGHAKLISNPSVITLDNELAQMIVADRIPIPRTHETEFGVTASYDFENVGIVLKVTPHITEDGYILMDARPEVNSIKDWTSGENPQPIISSRIAHSRVRIKDGQTLVIGGLIRDEQRETITRIPVLHGIPFLGRLFRSKSVDNVKTDLVVFITPRIYRDNPTSQ
jgi:general secretion pathway protein D